MPAYHPFGMLMPGRKFDGGSAYRYGFNGQEITSDVFNGTTTAEFWEYDSRTGRRWNVDPMTNEWESPYLTFSGNPIMYVDTKGNQPDPPEKRCKTLITQILYSEAIGIAAQQVHQNIQKKQNYLSDPAYAQGKQAVKDAAIKFGTTGSSQEYFNGGGSYSVDEFVSLTASLYKVMAGAGMWWMDDFEKLYTNTIFSATPPLNMNSEEYYASSAEVQLYSYNQTIYDRITDLDNSSLSVVTSAAEAATFIASAGEVPVGKGPKGSIFAKSIRNKVITAEAKNGLESIPKPGKGKGSVHPSLRDKKRLFSRKEVQENLESQGGTCIGCKLKLKLDEAKGHHVIRHADGGRTTKNNITTLCEGCHVKIHQ